jgi:hypothetical protein
MTPDRISIEQQPKGVIQMKRLARTAFALATALAIVALQTGSVLAGRTWP